MITEITEEDEGTCAAVTETQKERIRRIIEYQKYLRLSSNSSSSSSLTASAASCSSFSPKSGSLLELMKSGGTSLKRLFDMQHASLATHFNEYSGSPVIKPVLLWGSDTDDGLHDPWITVGELGAGPKNFPASDGQSKFSSEGSFMDAEFRSRKMRKSTRKLNRTKSFRRLPGFSLWRCRGFRISLRLRRLRIVICGKKC